MKGETIVKPGDAAGLSKAGVPNGHHLVNRTDRDAGFSCRRHARRQRERWSLFRELILVHDAGGDCPINP